MVLEIDAANDPLSRRCTAFTGDRLLKTGALAEVALAIKHASDAEEQNAILAFDDTTGRVIDIDPRGTGTEVLARLATRLAPPRAGVPSGETDKPSGQRGPGRPRLGVVAREITLLPRHWDWLAAQPGGASVVLRRLVEQERLKGTEKQKRRAAREAAYHFMSAMAGDRMGFEEASRALFADDWVKFGNIIAAWPRDVRDHAMRLAFGDGGIASSPKA